MSQPKVTHKIQVPIVTLLLSYDIAKTGKTEHSLIDWWNGGRLLVYDDSAVIATRYNDDSKLTAPYGWINPVKLNIQNNTFVECVDGDCQELKIFATNGALPGSDPAQLTEFTFGSSITGDKTIAYPWKVKDVGYNVSAVDSVYLPIAMEPLNAPGNLIPYIGTVMSSADFSKLLKNWLDAHKGWPRYNTTTLAHPKIPEAHTIFLEAFDNRNDKVLAPPYLYEAGGSPIDDMIKLYLRCYTKGPTDNTTCGRIHTLYSQLFHPNEVAYAKLPCAFMTDPTDNKTIIPFKDTFTRQLQTLYGWVPYDFAPVYSCGKGFNGNPLFKTVDKDTYHTLADSYRLAPNPNNLRQPVGLQYNYGVETDTKQWFNPYVQLIHDKNYLGMLSYAFSIDDAVGFQQHIGQGLIYAIGGTNGLQNANQLQPHDIVNVAYGRGASQWQMAGLCGYTKDRLIDMDPTFPSFDFFPKNLDPNFPTTPCTVYAQNANKKVYYFDIVQAPPNVKIDCSRVTQPDVLTWCMGTKVVDTKDTPLNYDHIIAPAIDK